MSDSSATAADFKLGRTALLEITEESTIGEPAGSIDEGDGVVSVYFTAKMAGYPGWRWTVSIAHVEGSAPTALETELMPGEGSLLSPEWVPWSDRLAEYKASQAEAGKSDDDSDDDDSDDDSDDDDFDDDDDDDDDDSDDDDFGDRLRGGDSAGDRDGIDIDLLEEDDVDSDVNGADVNGADVSGADVSDADAKRADVESATPPQTKVEKADQAQAETGDAGGQPQRAVRTQRGRKKQSDS